MKKQKFKGLELNKKSISNLSYKKLGGREGVETFDGLLSTMDHVKTERNVVTTATDCIVHWSWNIVHIKIQ